MPVHASTRRRALSLRTHAVVLGMPAADAQASLTRSFGTMLVGGLALTLVGVIAAFGGAEARGRALAAGFHAHVAKPVAPPDLVAAIAALAGPGAATAA